MSELVLALAQVNTAVGDFKANREKVLAYIHRARDAGADLVVFPELCLSGYPPEDLLLKPECTEASMAAARTIADDVGDIIAVVGFVEGDYDTFNSAAVISRGKIRCVYRKVLLPNYGVFDEKRYFGSGTHNLVLDIEGTRVGVTICEDIWFPGGPMEEQVAHGGAELVVNLSASPFNRGKHAYREKLVEARAMDGPVVIAYVNTVGAQDELVFDGGSCVYHPQSGVLARAARFREELLVCRVEFGLLRSSRMLEPRFRHSLTDYAHDGMRVCHLERPAHAAPVQVPRPEDPPVLTAVEEIFEALRTGLYEYVKKNGFSMVVLGLSGGIDSALTAAVASEALGPDNVTCIFMPSRYTARVSGTGAAELARNLGVRLISVPIEGLYEAYGTALSPELGGGESDKTFENIQARIRGNILMAFSNRFGWLVLATGNKSELSMGYCTLYGDMAGGFALIKDLLKTQVYEMSEYINRRAGHDIIPREIIERPPTAELREGQLDSDSLPPYDLLDPVLEAYIEQGMATSEIVAQGFDEALVRKVVGTVDANEYKRRQAPVGVKITPRAFGRDWRMPISNRMKGGC
ncbi:MAG: NAD+ synthase [Actinobacteria bacterium]|nr:NAD+ synthase [Actinomycetota bacterium]MBU4302571.1 NAD+ synthase [Actinomycetota bacterium]MBU4490334.1 NAD+ synthase [Actinomycetota bacterium]